MDQMLDHLVKRRQTDVVSLPQQLDAQCFCRQAAVAADGHDRGYRKRVRPVSGSWQ
jgi:hypothetical protein